MARIVIQGTGLGQVLGTDASGAARLRIKPDRLTMRANMMGKKMAMEMADGKVRVWENGKEVTGKQGMPMMPGGQKMPPVDQPFEIKISPRGEVLDMKIPALEQMKKTAPQMMPGMALSTLMKQSSQILLPAEPVAVGQTWQQTVPVPFTPQMSIPASYRAVLQKVEQVNGQQVAVIGVTSSISAPKIDLGEMFKQMTAGAAAAAGQPSAPMFDMKGTLGIVSNVAGTLKFNATGGFLQRFDGRMDTTVDVNVVTQAPPQAK